MRINKTFRRDIARAKIQRIAKVPMEYGFSLPHTMRIYVARAGRARHRRAPSRVQ
jgi:hypothetical protein